VIKTPKGQKIFYPGDTAYCEIFQEVGELFGPFDLTILPIGAYLPRHIMESSHVDPE
jgi:N-acyl-phosphatidylethanolamine-hydrolysing phospholipase D